MTGNYKQIQVKNFFVPHPKSGGIKRSLNLKEEDQSQKNFDGSQIFLICCHVQTVVN